ncbi:hypothetical protein YC2023_016204 [Brassica napus]
MSRRSRIKDKQQRDEKSKISRRVNTNLFITEISTDALMPLKSSSVTGRRRTMDRHSRRRDQTRMNEGDN